MDPLRGPGVIEGQVADPVGTVRQAAETSRDVFSGLGTFVFGTPTYDARGSYGGIFGDTPLVGDIGRLGTDLVSRAVGFVGNFLNNAVGVTGDVLNRINFGVSPELKDRFDEIPDEFPAKQEAFRMIEAEGNRTGAFTGAAHHMAWAIREYRADVDMRSKDPSLTDNLFMENVSLAATIMNVFGLMGLPGRYVERWFAGAERAGGTQIQQIMDVGDGKMVFPQDPGLLGTGLFARQEAGLNDVEQHVYDMVKAGVWDHDEAADFISARGRGFSSYATTQIAAQILLDPLNVLALGGAAAAKAGKVGVQLVRTRRAALDALRVAEEVGDQAQIAKAKELVHMASQGIRSKDHVRRINILGQIAKQPLTGHLARSFGELYEVMALSSMGKVAKLTRTVIDPLHLWGDHPRLQKALVRGSIAIPERMAATHGYGNYGHLGFLLGSVPGMGQGTLDNFHLGVAVYAGNAFQRIAARQFLTTQFWRGTLRAMVEEPDQVRMVAQVLDDVFKVVGSNTMRKIDEELARFIKYDWTPADLDDLARRSHRMLESGLGEDEWRLFVNGLNNEQRSLLHAGTYGMAVSRLHRAIQESAEAGISGPFMDRLGDFILLNRGTLTDEGWTGIRNRIAAAAGDNRAILAEIEDAKRKYPVLRGFAEDPHSETKTIDTFLEHLDNIKPRLPHQILYHERPNLPQPLRDFDALISPDPDHGIFTLGFKPRAEYRWGIETDALGRLRPFGDPWYDQISDVTMSGLQVFRGVSALSYNTAGIPLGPLMGAASRVVDATEQAGRTMVAGVTGVMVTQAARKKFLARVAPRLRDAGVPDTKAEDLWNSLVKALEGRKDLSGIRGLGQSDMWAVSHDVVRHWPAKIGYNRRDLMLDIMYAYEGDLRTVGLTQWFTGRVKRMVAQYTNRNIAGVLGEHIWPLLRFRYNPFFQMQEKSEPWILAASRGIMPAWRRDLNEVDEMTAAIYKRFVDSNLVSMADQDIAEMSGRFAIGSELEILSMDRDTAIAKLKEFMDLDAIFDVQGPKRLHMLRTFKKGLARDFRRSWDQHKPGEFDKILADARARAGYHMDEDEFVVRWVHENLNANDVVVSFHRNADGTVASVSANFENAIKTGWEAAPQHFGELRRLDVDRVVRRMAWSKADGDLIGDEIALRRALATGDIAWEKIERDLLDMGAHREYVQRFRANLLFNWNDWWGRVRTAYNLTDIEMARMQNWFGRAAERRGMTPVEFMSQVYSPNIARDGKFSVGSLGAAVEYMRGVEPDLAVLAPGPNADAAELFRQVAAVTIHHLDPSGKRALLRALVGTPDDKGVLFGLLDNAMMESIDGLDAVVVDGNVINAFADRLMGYFQGKPPTGQVVRVADDALPDLGFIRDNATREMVAAGRGPINGRRIVQTAEDLREEAGRLMPDLPPFRQVRTRADPDLPVDLATIDRISRDVVGPASRTLRIEASHLPATISEAWVQYVTETRRLYRSIVDDLGIQVRIVKDAEPYTNADDLRAGLMHKTTGGRRAPFILEPERGHYHPIMREADAFMARVVREVYGYGQEATAFGDDAAFFKAAAVYSDQSRGVMLVDEWGRLAEEKYSTRVVPSEAEMRHPETIEAFEMRYGRALEAPTPGAPRAEGGEGIVTRVLGQGVHRLDKAGQSDFVSTLSRYLSQFHRVRFGGWDIIDDVRVNGAASYFGVPFDPFSPTTAIFGADSTGWNMDPVARRHWMAGQDAKGRRHYGKVAHVWKDRQGKPRLTYRGDAAARLPGNVRPFSGYGAEAIVLHEMGHAIDCHLRRMLDVKRLHIAASGKKMPAWATGKPEPWRYADEKFTTFMKKMLTGEIRTRISGYAQTTYNTAGETMNDADAFAEALVLALLPDNELDAYVAALRKLKRAKAPVEEWRDPVYGTVIRGPHRGFDAGERALSPFLTPNGILDEELITTMDEFRQHLKRMGVWDPEHVPFLPDSPHAGKTFGEVNRAAPGTFAVERRTGFLPQEFVDRLMAHHLGTGRFAESNPEMARLAHFVKDTMTDATQMFFQDVTGALPVRGVLVPQKFTWDDVWGVSEGLPSIKGTPYNQSEALLWYGFVQAMTAKWEDAFRLQYFAQQRSMLERSINHPMFGLYPASYMWGKIGPELIKFLALEPFGINTGVGVSMLHDLQMGIAMQRTYDRDFDAKIEEMGHSPTMQFLEFMMPGSPWSLPVTYSPWLREIARQGLRMRDAAAAGEVAPGINWMAPLTVVASRTAPMVTMFPWLQRIVEEHAGRPPQGTNEYDAWLADEVRRATDAGRLLRTGAPGEEVVDFADTTTAPMLQPILEDQMGQLRDILGR